MNEQNNPDLLALAREVLDDAQYLAAIPSVATVARTQVMISLAEAAPDLARAVIDLTDKVERMEALADRLDVVANELEAEGEDGYADAARTDAHSIRAALNGDPR